MRGLSPLASRNRWRGVAAAFAVLALIAGAVGWAHQARPEPRAATNPAPVHQEPTRPPATDQQARPVRVTIPSIKVSATISSVGLNPDKTVEVPVDPDQVGWYRLGSAPGQPGSAVLLGHVDSKTGPAVFQRLGSIKDGAVVVVRRDDGSSARFRVTRTATYANADFPAQRVYRIDGPPTLTLITCGGSYDRARGGYQANVVVTATLV